MEWRGKILNNTNLQETEYVDYYNLNGDLKDYKDIEIKVSGTAFGYNVYYLKDDYAKSWTVNTDGYPNTRGYKGIDTIIRFQDSIFQATTNAQPSKNASNLVTKKGKKYISDTQYIEKEITRCSDGYYKISAGVEFTSTISDTFWATRLVKRMAKKGQKVDLGESMTARVHYEILKGEPKIVIDILRLNSLDNLKEIPKTLTLHGEEISYNFCRLIEQKFASEHICIQPEEASEDITWSSPTDWIYPDNKSYKAKYEASFQIKYGVYMWIGTKNSEPQKKYLYIGFVGTDRNKNNTVGNRIFNQEMKSGIGYENGIDKIECFRYSELKNSGKLSAEQVLQTVEMQCINNFSSFFGYNDSGSHSNPESIINNLFDGVCLNGQGYTLQLLNRMKRYNNSGK